MRKNSCLILGLVVGGGLLLLALIAMFFIWGRYNSMVTEDEAVNSAWAQVETVLQRRYDLIPNLVNTVKGFAKQESSVLEEVTRLRSQWGQAQSVPEKTQAANA
jgi:LemA protein